ncbi:MAG: dienelactone hydrolase family protein [Pirellulaceae bacterium]|nr:dienelactone hydrolase family protein [Pirellulaceae bacterium]MDP7016798.1 dienelactone hydrolase family protein [Pirellulaceae bacterium]
MDFLFDGPADARATLILAHGAGAAMDTPFMDAFAAGVAEAEIQVARFEFDYMRLRRVDGKRRGPDRLAKLIACWEAAIDHFGSAGRLFAGGKSMGGRIASLVADRRALAGLVCLGYPFHPAGKPAQLRTEHLAELKTPALFVQGERDSFGNREEVSAYELSPAIEFAWLPDGDHSFKPRKSSSATEADNWSAGVAAVVEFIRANSL